jgi:hypothetical protein
MAMIQDLLLALRLLKIEMWREQTAIANGLRTHLYQKNLDPYGFSPSQFDSDVARICDAKGVLQEAVIDEISLKLKQHESQKMEDMFSGKVLQPFLAQNKDHHEVDPSDIYASLLAQVKLRMEKNDETLQKRHASIQEEIVKFMQFTADHNIRTQKIAQALIKRYALSNSDTMNIPLKATISCYTPLPPQPNSHRKNLPSMLTISSLSNSTVQNLNPPSPIASTTSNSNPSASYSTLRLATWQR